MDRPDAMDYFSLAVPPGRVICLLPASLLTKYSAPGRAQYELDMTLEEETTGKMGLTEFLVNGLKIQEAQYVIVRNREKDTNNTDRLSLRTHVRSLGTGPSMAEKVDLSKRRGKLRVRVAEHQKKARRFLKLTDEEEDNENFEFGEPEVLLDTDDLPSDVDVFYESTEIERYSVAMPSSLSAETRERRLLRKAVDSEIQLRIGQCNDALQGIRMAIGKKAFIYVSDVRKAKTTKGKTRSYDDIKVAHRALQHQAQLYRCSRKALLDLGADKELLEKYQMLHTSQLSTKDTFLDVTERGQKHLNLPWFWNLDVEGDSEDNSRMEECKCYSVRLKNKVTDKAFSLPSQLVTGAIRFPTGAGRGPVSNA